MKGENAIVKSFKQLMCFGILLLRQRLIILLWILNNVINDSCKSGQTAGIIIFLVKPGITITLAWNMSIIYLSLCCYIIIQLFNVAK